MGKRCRPTRYREGHFTILTCPALRRRCTIIVGIVCTVKYQVGVLVDATHKPSTSRIGARTCYAHTNQQRASAANNCRARCASRRAELQRIIAGYRQIDTTASVNRRRTTRDRDTAARRPRGKPRRGRRRSDRRRCRLVVNVGERDAKTGCKRNREGCYCRF